MCLEACLLYTFLNFESSFSVPTFEENQEYICSAWFFIQTSFTKLWSLGVIDLLNCMGPDLCPRHYSKLPQFWLNCWFYNLQVAVLLCLEPGRSVPVLHQESAWQFAHCTLHVASRRRFPHQVSYVSLPRELLHHRLVHRVAPWSPDECGHHLLRSCRSGSRWNEGEREICHQKWSIFYLFS